MSKFYWGWFVGWNCGCAAIVLLTTPLHTIKDHWIELWQKMFLT